MALVGFWHYLAVTLPVALAIWALVEWRQRSRRAAQARRRRTWDEPTWNEPGHEQAVDCPHPRFKRVHTLRDGVNVPTDEMQCVQCRQRMKG